MKTFVLSVALGTLSVLFSSAASAMPVTVQVGPSLPTSGSTVAFQSLPKNFVPGTNDTGKFTVTLLNSTGIAGVSMTPAITLARLDGFAFAAPISSVLTATTLTQVYDVSAATLASIASDGKVTFRVQGTGVGVGTQVMASLTAVPEPATMTLLGLGAVAGVVMMRRRRNQAAPLAA
ncbi:PEP-CTERM sorting domain-containing protein [Allorhodopirellula heiligendammensis]|uniref:PEP-CTERM motif protein n=1 Tax=Allorhodopirellula heiligendammensis TaxID=2714739 RepID=A0A5C6C1U0_9BACT|nr:PEP-CTERM sorting domain-containing protein [Allorhodopirellula heiligendammensis]TWU18088.1 PEP-CTERM motif protein [Allorhodopirellula heiligendammensis]